MPLNDKNVLNIKPLELICLENSNQSTSNFPYILIIPTGIVLYDIDKNSPNINDYEYFFNFTLNKTGDFIYSIECKGNILDIQRLIHMPSLNKAATNSFGPKKPSQFKIPPYGKEIYDAREIYYGKNEIIGMLSKKGHNLEPYLDVIKSIKPSKLKSVDLIERRVNNTAFTKL